MDNPLNTAINSANEVEKNCLEPSNPVSVTFKTLFLERGKRQQDLADGLGIDKAYVSRVVNGKEIPPLKLRLAIARWFEIDSSLIWRSENLDYIRSIIEQQKKELKKEEIINENP